MRSSVVGALDEGPPQKSQGFSTGRRPSALRRAGGKCGRACTRRGSTISCMTTASRPSGICCLTHTAERISHRPCFRKRRVGTGPQARPRPCTPPGQSGCGVESKPDCKQRCGRGCAETTIALTESLFIRFVRWTFGRKIKERACVFFRFHDSGRGVRSAQRGSSRYDEQGFGGVPCSGLDHCYWARR